MTDTHAPCYGLLLAAGVSKRFGADKRLQTLPSGGGIAQTSLAHWLAACELGTAGSALTGLYLVTRERDPLAKHLHDWLGNRSALPATLLTAIDADLGMGHTLANAVQQIPTGALIVGLADMPWVQPDTVRRIAASLRATDHPNSIVQPEYAGKPGNPLGFGDGQRAALARATGDTGARQLVQAARRDGLVTRLPVDDPGIVLDIDTPADLAGGPGGQTKQ